MYFATTRTGKNVITPYLSNGGTQEHAQQVAGARVADTVTVDEIGENPNDSGAN